MTNKNLAGTAVAIALAVLIMVSLLGCSLTSFIGAPTPTPTSTRTPKPTFTPTATYTPTPVETPTPIPTDTPTATPTPAVTDTPTPTETATRRPSPPTPTRRPATPTPRGPTPTPVPSYPFRYVRGSILAQPNCGTVYMHGKVIGVGGEGVNGKTVRLRFAGNVAWKISGQGEDPGDFGFAPLSMEHFHSPFVFQIDIVESQANPVPLSDTLDIVFTNCGQNGQFTNIVFEYVGG